MSERIEYRSDNGYWGVLYGKSSMSIKDKDGNEVLHTGFRTPNTLEELKKVVETMPELMEMHQKYFDEMFANDEGEPL